MITVRGTFIGVFLLLILSAAVLVIAVPILLPPGTNTAEGLYRSIPFKILALLSLLLIIGLGWTYFSTRALEVKRSARILRQQVGHVFEERFEVSNPGLVGTLWLEIADQSPIPGKQGSRVLSSLGRRQDMSYITRTLLTRRGAFQLGPTLLRSGDPFGLFLYTKEYDPWNTLLVLPMVVDIHHFPQPAGFLPGGRALRTRTPEVTPYAASVREYAPGDPLSRIHWRSTARRDRLMVKEFEQDPLADIWVFVDADEAVNIGERAEDHIPGLESDPFWIWANRPKVTLPPETFEYAVTIAASVANYYIRLGRTVGLASASRNLAVLSAERGERQLGKILETLAFLQSDGRLPLLGLVEAQARHLQRGSTVVLVTPSTQQSIEAAVDELLRRDIRPIVVLIDPESFGGQETGGEIAIRLQSQGVPVCQISYGDSLEASLGACF